MEHTGNQPQAPAEGASASELQSLKAELIENLSSAVTPNTDTPEGEQIQSGQLELVAEAINHEIQRDENIVDPKKTIPNTPESLRMVDYKTHGDLILLYRKNKALFQQSLAGYNPNNKPTKESVIPLLRVDLGSNSPS